MQISGSLPMHIARAYGVTPQVRPAAPLAPAAPATPATPAADSSKLNQLVAGTVNVNASPPTTPTVAAGAADGPYQLYTRAADRIEAATAVQIGRSIDVRG
ncbi:MAG: hypothetical protein ACYTGP_06980 [Planctomycetota bacterium]|jgi:hypothetical protein